MLQILKSENDLLRDLDPGNFEKGAWINLMDPSSEELNIVKKLVDMPLDVLTAALDEEESARMEIENEYILVLIDVPRKRDNDRYETLPLGIILLPDTIITVCLEETDVLTCFNRMTARLFDTGKRTRFLFNMLYRSATFFLRYLRQINIRTDEIERHLRQSMKNEELFQLLEMEKSLTYFTASLRTNHMVIDKLLRLRNNQKVEHLLKIYEEDEDILEDALVEYRQAIEMVQMYSQILSGMMDAFASIISNNLNMVMKFLTSMTIILAIPTMFASFWGMNVGVPWLGKVAGFWVVTGISAFATIGSAYALWRRNML
jgi:magnesium transporter